MVLEALAAIRSEIGDDLPITLRISGYERVAGGRPLYETAQVAPLLVEAGVDCLPCQRRGDRPAGHGMVNGADDGDALNVGAAAAVKEVVDVPVIAVGRIHDPRAPSRFWPTVVPTSSRWAARCSPTPSCRTNSPPAGPTGSAGASRAKTASTRWNNGSQSTARSTRATGKERDWPAPRTTRQATWWWSAAAPPGWRPRGWPPSAGTASRCSNVTTSRRRTVVGVDPAPGERAVPPVPPRRDRPQPRQGELGQEVDATMWSRLHPTPSWWPTAAGSCCRPPRPTCRTCRPDKRCGRGSAAGGNGWSGQAAVRMASKAWLPLGHGRDRRR